MFHGHATTTEDDKIKGTMVSITDEPKGTVVPNDKVNLAEGQCKRTENHNKNTEN